MSGTLNGSPQRRPKLAVDNSLAVAVAERLDRHIEACDAKGERTNERLDKIEHHLTGLASGLNELTGQVKLVTGLFAKERTGEDGTTELAWHIPKPSFKTLLSIVGAFGGIVLVVQFVVAVAGPALKGAAEFVLSYGH